MSPGEGIRKEPTMSWSGDNVIDPRAETSAVAAAPEAATGTRGGVLASARVRGAWLAFAVVVVALAASSAYGYLFADPDVAVAMDRAMRPWYGNWPAAVFSVALFTAFVLGLLRSPRPRAWRHLGVAEAYLVALFAEMYGVPLTIYLLGSVLGAELGFGMLEGHLWAVLLDRLGLLSLPRAVALVMATSSVLIVVGLALMVAGWWQVWRARGELVTGGLYRFARHPQYAGLLLLVLGFFVQWPTLPTALLLPVLVAVYLKQARREEAELEARFGGRYRHYRDGTPMLLPGWPMPRAL